MGAMLWSAMLHAVLYLILPLQPLQASYEYIYGYIYYNTCAYLHLTLIIKIATNILHIWV